MHVRKMPVLALALLSLVAPPGAFGGGCLKSRSSGENTWTNIGRGVKSFFKNFGKSSNGTEFIYETTDIHFDDTQYIKKTLGYLDQMCNDYNSKRKATEWSCELHEDDLGTRNMTKLNTKLQLKIFDVFGEPGRKIVHAGVGITYSSMGEKWNVHLDLNNTSEVPVHHTNLNERRLQLSAINHRVSRGPIKFHTGEQFTANLSIIDVLKEIMESMKEAGPVYNKFGENCIHFKDILLRKFKEKSMKNNRRSRVDL